RGPMISWHMRRAACCASALAPMVKRPAGTGSIASSGRSTREVPPVETTSATRNSGFIRIEDTLKSVRGLVLVFLLASAARADPSTARGIALGLFAEDPGWSYRPLLDEIAATGADHVELVVAWYQDDAASTELGDHPRFTVPEAALRRAIRD